MSRSKKGLGRGFDSLIPTQLLDDEFDPTSEQDEKISDLRTLRILDIEPNKLQPRRHFDPVALEELSNSIQQHGVMQPIVVTPKGGGYELVAGERRWRASQMAGLEEIPAIVRDMNDQQKLELALIENLQRQDLNPLETATAYLKLHQQFNMSYEEIGQHVGGKAVSTISNIMRLLALPKEAKKALIEGEISEGHARQILAIKEPEVQKELLDLILRNGWSVRKAEQFVIGYKEGAKDRQTAREKVKTETVETQRLSQRISADVSVKHMAKGGRLIIQFKNDDDLNRITGLLLN
ncbi:MAG TPA: ParB/RepB/Spo0J family partition protein [Candidatus Saccharimonadales bacterium]|nr:ParB/RepB/Spo0J family partition protein [Candidatus Saccharimonadales bacterium]